MKSLLLLILSFAIVCSVFADATRVVTNERGSFTESYLGERGPVRDHVPPLDDPVLLWSRNLATGIFYSCAITTDQYAFSGSSLNDPREAAQYLINGDGTPVMALNGRGWKVAAAPDGGYWAALDTNWIANTFVLYLMTDASSTPVWTYTLVPGGAANTDGLQFSNDGGRLALFYYRAGMMPQLLVWDMIVPDSTPILNYEFVAGQGMYPRAMEMSADGGIIACTADQYCTIIETEGGIVRNVIDFQASTDGLALSADGNFVMGAFSAAKLWRWDGTSYVLQWQSSAGGRYCSQLLISPDTTYAVSCWYPAPGYNRNYIRVHDIHNGSQIWAYTYHLDSGEYQDWPIDADISADGNWFAIGSWGDQGNSNGEVVVFSRWYPTPYYELDMAGSCFTLDLSHDGHYLIAGGKHVHANIFGNGGDLYAVDLDNLNLGPEVQIVDTVWINPDTVCACDDTVLINPRIANIGYAPFTVEGIFVSRVMEDTSYAVIDSSQIGLVVFPGDTVAIRAWYAPCAYYAGFVTIQVGTSAGLFEIPASVPFEYCTGAQEPVVLQPSSLNLSAYPNPFNSSASLSFSLPRTGNVRLTLVDILGREVETIADRSFTAGVHQLNFKADYLASGIYFARLSSPFGVRTQKLMLLR